MNILVTGGAGYIGSATAEALIQAGHQVVVVDSLVTGHRTAVPDGAEFFQIDLGDGSEVTKVLSSRSFEAVMHFAAWIEAGESMLDPGKYYWNNVSNSLQLIEAVVLAGVKRFVFSSSAAVYETSDKPLREDSPLGPNNVYGHTKLMVEGALEWYGKIYSLPYASLRYFNAAGALPHRGEAHQPESHLIPMVLQAALGLRPAIHIYGTDYPTPDGTCIRDYIHISDLVTAHLLALEALGDSRQPLIYNLGNGAGYSVREVIEAAREITGLPIPVQEAPHRPGDAPRLVASSDRIRRELGWQPRHPALRGIIASAWEWHRSHPHGYD
jgi:UDP-glucose 4-epimerase